MTTAVKIMVTAPVELTVALATPVAPEVPAIGPSSSDAMVQYKKQVYLLFTCLLV